MKLPERTVTIALLLSLCLLASTAWADTFVNRKTGEKVTGRCLGSVFKDGNQQFYVKGDDGKRRVLRQDEWERTASRAPATVKPKAKGGNTMAVDFGGPAKSTDAPAPTKTVLATGIGISQEKARQSAFSSAIEQTVGLLVDSETLVKNDTLVREQILTVSRGYIEKFDVLKEWQADGLHHARIQAVVSVTRLVAQLTAHHIAVKGVEGERMSRQAKFEVKNEEHAGELFGKIMDDYTIAKLFKVEILGKPEVVKKDAVQATLKVKVELSPNWDQWRKMQAQLKPILEKVATKKSAFITLPQAVPMETARRIRTAANVTGELTKRLAGQGAVICLLRKVDRKGTVTTWDIYRVPDSSGLFVSAMTVANGKPHAVRVALLDADGKPVTEASKPMGPNWDNDAKILVIAYMGAYSMGPLFWRPGNYEYKFVYPLEFTIQIELDKLAKVTQVVAFAENPK